MHSLTLFLPNSAATERAGRALASVLAPPMIVTLSGEIGAGKTTFARGVLRGLGWTGPVKSPSYALVEYYPLSSLYLYHFDFYRFEDPAEWDDSGVEEGFRNDTVCLVEWPERVADRLPPADIAITLAEAAGGANTTGSGRRLTAAAATPAGERCLSVLAAAMQG